MSRCLPTLLLLVAACSATMAQHTITPAGGNGGSSMGGVSWTLGQVDFTNDPAGHVQQGVQQPYTDIGTAVEEPSGAPAFVLAPNPASGDAVLATTSTASGTWTWTLTDAGGRTVLDGPLYGSTTTIPATALAQGAYQLTVLRDGTPHTTLTLLKR